LQILPVCKLSRTVFKRGSLSQIIMMGNSGNPCLKTA
jgi:hypothetical protein